MSNQSQVYEYWRTMQLNVRLDFLKFVTRLYPPYWNSTTLADTLWNSLIVDPIGPQEQDETFSCLEAMNDLDFVLHIYDKLLPTLDIASMTPRAWHCVRQYFMVINWHRQNILVVCTIGSLMSYCNIFVPNCRANSNYLFSSFYL